MEVDFGLVVSLYNFVIVNLIEYSVDAISSAITSLRDFELVDLQKTYTEAIPSVF